MITRKIFGKLKNGKQSCLYEMSNANGMQVGVTEIGCSIVTLRVPDKSGGLRDVVFGFNNPADYVTNKAYFGCAVGRVANRIASGKFELDGKKYELEKNDHGAHHLHGGSSGYALRQWDALPYDPDGFRLEFSLISPDGDAGYPGRLNVKIAYTLLQDNALKIDYHAETDSKTLCNLTNHSYFNLEGHCARDIYAQELQIFSDKITSVDETLIPTGEFTDVAGTPFDFREGKPIGRDIEAAGGYDHNFALNAPGLAARVYSPKSGIEMKISTDSPGIQLYTGNFLDGSIEGKDGAHHHRQSGFCLETQFFPDSINHPSFAPCVVEKGAPQDFYTTLAFSVK